MLPANCIAVRLPVVLQYMSYLDRNAFGKALGVGVTGSSPKFYWFFVSCAASNCSIWPSGAPRKAWHHHSVLSALLLVNHGSDRIIVMSVDFKETLTEHNLRGPRWIPSFKLARKSRVTVRVCPGNFVVPKGKFPSCGLSASLPCLMFCSGS